MFDMFNEENKDATYSGSTSSSSDSNSEANNVTRNIHNGRGFVISVGGSVFIGDKPLTEKISNFCYLLNELSNEFRFILVVGGGATARNYQASAKELGANNFELDSIGIMSTRLNAMLFSQKLEKADKNIHTNFDSVKESVDEGRIPIFGGMSEGQTTDAVGALLAEKLNFEFINLSNVDGIYSDDPNENQDATMFKELSFNDMIFLLREKLLIPGQHIFVDPQAASIISRSKINSYFLNGDHLENFKNCLRNNDYKGTIVHEMTDVIEHEHNAGEFEKIKEGNLSKPVHDEFVDHHFKDDEEEDEVIDPRKIDFGK